MMEKSSFLPLLQHITYVTRLQDEAVNLLG